MVIAVTMVEGYGGDDSSLVMMNVMAAYNNSEI